jgi:hypothetical protein
LERSKEREVEIIKRLEKVESTLEDQKKVTRGINKATQVEIEIEERQTVATGTQTCFSKG